ncbi:DMT family transporter, partial [Terriglobus sp. YAF25]
MRSRKHLGGFLLLSLLWGSTWAAIRVSVQHMPVLRSVALRFLIASVVLLVGMKLRRESLPALREWPMLIGFSLLTIVIPFCMIGWSAGRVSSGLTSILFSASPLVVLLLEVIACAPSHRRRLSRGVLIGLLSGVIGIICVMHSARSSSSEVGGVVAIVVVVLLGSWSGITAQRHLGHLPPLTVSGCLSVSAAILIGVASLLLDRGKSTRWDMSAVEAILFLGIFSSALGFFLFYWLLREVRPYT